MKILSFLGANQRLEKLMENGLGRKQRVKTVEFSGCFEPWIAPIAECLISCPHTNQTQIAYFLEKNGFFCNFLANFSETVQTRKDGFVKA